MECGYVLYAEDTVIYFADKTANVACREVENALKKIQSWCDYRSNKLRINIKNFSTWLSHLKKKHRTRIIII